MQLTRFSDLGLRLLMYLAVNEREAPPVTVAEVAQQFNIARNHLVKVSATLTKYGYIQSIRGRTGGIVLARAPDQIRIGDVVRLLEGSEQLIDCDALHCVLNPACGLKAALHHSLMVFYETLNTYTLTDVLKGKSTGSIQQIQRNYIRLAG
ncbi:transcriptional regulator, BadM/Rrf2 family [Methylophilus rhizosphaerae]|uniref:Transcriptional regulator, BadM/Rrf2 family n=1 Tax=Methylophilus rhizosphaerae TaxID=492660 RepID=A0A1G9CRY5_9PROT|nr:Rrf2 family transcriptional regulator [Methylophilus rhizosphaerae]SDK54471.1 transcriptional regulator, BadM/Rrf2 family [Methylophilus rhizosphaerae]